MPGAVAGLGIRAARRAMREPAQDLEPLVDDRARAFALDVGDEPDATRVATDRRIYQASPGKLRHFVAPL